MIDVQKYKNQNQIAINRVGISKIKYPIYVVDRKNDNQQTVADFTMSVDLAKEDKGTHMSRFIEILKRFHQEINHNNILNMIKETRIKLEADNAFIKLEFPFFLDRKAPVSESSALLDYECWFECEGRGDNLVLKLGVKVPVTSLCPCSKTISKYGAHNQRGIITIDVEMSDFKEGHPNFIYFEELIDIAEQSASCKLYPILKRPDEKYVTEYAYDNPVFVEDMVRNVAIRLNEDHRIRSYKIHCENFESIHNHSAFAEIQK